MNKPVYLANAFSLQMLRDADALIEVTAVDALPTGLESAIGHPDTAAVLGVPMNRCNVSLQRGDTLYVAQLVGGRLPEGSTTLPEGFSFRYYRIYLR